LAKYLALQGPRGFLGYPISDEVSTSNGRGRKNEFQGGAIYFSDRSGANEVHGSIRQRWNELGGENSFLGLPTTDQGAGNIAQFEAGVLELHQGGFISVTADVREIRPGTIHIDGAAANGTPELVLSSNGAFRFNGRMRATGIASYNVAM